MGRYSQIHTQIWSDEKFISLSDKDKLLFLYLLTSRHSNMLGYYHLPLPYVAADLGWAVERVTEGLKNLKPMILFDASTNVVLIRHYLLYNPVKGPKQVVGAINQLIDIPRNKLWQHFLEVVQQYSGMLRDKLNTLPESYAKGIDTVSIPETETETETETEKHMPPKLMSTDVDNSINSQKTGQAVIEIYQHYCKTWIDVFPRGPKLTKERVQKIKQRLKSFSVDELKQACDAMHSSEWHRGVNPQNVAYGTIDFLMKNDSSVDKWLSQGRASPPRKEFGVQLSEEQLQRLSKEGGCRDV